MLKRLSMYIPWELHKEIKMRAAARNVTITTWVIRAIFEALRNEKKYE